MTNISESQLEANRENSRRSTGPITESGKAASSRNSLASGLFTKTICVEPEERGDYLEFCQTMLFQLRPDGLLESSLTDEIAGATWRLRRCSLVESTLDDLDFFCEEVEKRRRSVDRARAGAHSLLHRSINQFRRLQTDRLTRQEILGPDPVPDYMGIADAKHITVALNAFHKGARAQNNKAQERPGMSLDELEALLEDGDLGPAVRESVERVAKMASFCNSSEAAENTEVPEAAESEAAAPQPEIEQEAPETRSEPVHIPRNALCPEPARPYPHSCGEREDASGQRCCGRNAPPVLGMESIGGQKAA
jgi:hypothetical protein